MDLSLTEEQQMLKNSAREFLERECPASYVRAMEEEERGYTSELWKKMAHMGWLGLVFPEAYGGMGGSFLDLCVLLEEMGRALLPGPFFSTVILGGLSLLEGGSEAQKRELLPPLVQGDLVLTMALMEPHASLEARSVQMRAIPTDGDFVLNGVKLFVPNAHVADYLVVVARTREGDHPEEGITLFLLPSRTPGVRQELLKTIASDRQSEVVFQEVKASAQMVLGPLHRGWPLVARVLERAAVAKCAEMLGGAQRVLEMTVEYAKQRVQFGRPIGSFQAIQHHCANMAIEVEGSRHVTYHAAWRLAQGLPAAQEVSVAKAWVSQAYRKVTALAHQVHGAIGFTREHDLQLYTRRAKAGEVLFGDVAFHKERVAQALGL